MLGLSHFELVLHPPSGCGWILLQHLLDMEGFAPLPLSLHEEDVDASAMLKEIGFRGLGPFRTQIDMTAKLIVEADFGESAVADDHLWVGLAGQIEWRCILLDGGGVVRLRAREVQGHGADVLGD